MHLNEVKSTGRRKRWRPVRLAAVVATALLGAMLTAAGLLLYLLAHDGIGSDWLRVRLEESLDRRLPANVETRIGRVVLALRADSGLVVAAGDVALRLPDGTRIEARAVTTTADIAALIRGEIDPSLLRIEGARIVIGPLPEVVDARSRADQVRDGARMLAVAVDAVDRELRAAGFEDLQIADAQIAFADRELSLPLARTFDHIIEASWMPLGPKRSKLWAEMGAEGRPWTLTFERNGMPGQALAVDVTLADLPISELWPALADPQQRPYYSAPTTILARINLDADGGFSRLRGRASAGIGYLSLSPEDDISMVETADLVFDLGGKGDDVVVRRMEVRAGQTVLNLAGAVDLRGPGEAVAISAALGPGSLAARPGLPAVPISGGHFIGAFDPASQALTIDSLEVAGPQGEATLAGSLAESGSGAGLALALSIGEMSVEMARALWPPMAAPKVRRWFDKHVGSATIGPGTLQIALPDIYLGPEGRGLVLPGYGLVGELPFRDASFSPLGSIPPVSGAAGAISFADATAIVILQSGSVEVPNGTLQAADTIMVVPELGGPDPVADITLRLAGPTAALAQVADSKPLVIASRKGIAAAALSGNADLSLSARIPLDENTEIVSLQPQFRLMLDDFASEAPIAGRAIGAGELVLQGHPDDYTISGTATVDGIAATLDMRAAAGEEDSAVELILDAPARQRLGIGLDGMLDGVVKAVLEEPGSDGGRPVSLDLTASRFKLPFLGWEKGRGVPAQAEFVLHEGSELIAVSGFSLSGEGFRAKGEITLERETGRLQSMQLSEVSLRPGDNFAVGISDEGDSYNVAVTGRAFDARGLVAELRNESSGDDEGTVTYLSIGLDEVTALNGVVLRRVKGSAVVDGGRLKQMALSGETEAGKAFDCSVTEENGSRRTVLRTADGGAVLGGLGLYGRIAGGELTLDMTGPAERPDAHGLLTLNRFRIVDEEALASAVAPAVARASNRSQVHQIRQADVDARNMQFSTLQIPFERRGDVVHVREAFLRGPMLGGTGSGTIDLGDSSIAISGSLIPVFGLNNIAGAIPILGEILGGGRNEGLVGITYKLLGPLDSPTLHMNPLSAIAPGIFRKIFEYR
jgi:hypothetical protein